MIMFIIIIINLNLEQYGIYSNISDIPLNESCLIHAIKQSQQLSAEEIERLKHFIKTRTYLLENLPLICDEFDISLSRFYINNYEEWKDMNKMTVKKQGEYILTKCSINIETLINQMITMIYSRILIIIINFRHGAPKSHACVCLI